MDGMLNVGKAAEHLVCFDLLKQGYRAFLSDQGLPYDLLLDVDDKIYRVQVKATLKPTDCSKKSVKKHRTNRQMYKFTPKRRGVKGKGKSLSREECDIVALVAIDIQAIAYLWVEDVPSCIELRIKDDETDLLNYKRKFGKDIKSYPIKDLIC